MATYLFSARTTNGNSSAVAHPGGPALLVVRGTFDGATVKIQVSDDGTNWVDLQYAAFTAAIATLIDLPIGTLIRANVASAGAGTSITVAI
jgi:regulation of enolase protein 1 (concanavalin A-like superfamily)